NPLAMKALVVVLRGCPAGWLGAYGNEWVATPNLDRLAAESVVFDSHISDHPEAAAADAAWLGGEPAHPVLSTLKDADVHTLLIRANHAETDGPDWFYAGWSEVFDARPLEGGDSPLEPLLRDLPAILTGIATFPNVLIWIEIDRLLPPWDVRQAVFQAYLEDVEGDDLDDFEPREKKPHEDGEDEEGESGEPDHEESPVASQPPEEPVTPWYDPPTGPFDSFDDDAWEWLQTTFAAVVTSLDAELGVMFDELRSRGFDKSSAWLVTSDYGYPLGEHVQVGLHRPWLHEELVHLPLIVRLPDAAEACRRVSGFTQPPDIAATLLDLFGIATTEGHSLLPMARGDADSPRQYAISTLELHGAAESSIRTQEWAYLLPVRVPEGETRNPMLFHRPDDRWESNDLLARNIDRADELEKALNAALEH
ncbi:MAG TPA: sulfatase-like hydrolase/transferase, partial [Gemmata sp.]|nr:sulfatase-like hydrolase/transferase [Gemmata sp.]